MGVNMGLGPITIGAANGAAEFGLNEPRYEAAFFYGLFLRGYPLEKLREDIDVSPKVLERWNRLAAGDPWYRATVERMLNYRKEVLAIFDSLVLRELPATPRIQ
jgi:hypothetical protein